MAVFRKAVFPTSDKVTVSRGGWTADPTDNERLVKRIHGVLVPKPTAACK